MINGLLQNLENTPTCHFFRLLFSHMHFKTRAFLNDVPLVHFSAKNAFPKRSPPSQVSNIIDGVISSPWKWGNHFSARKNVAQFYTTPEVSGHDLRQSFVAEEGAGTETAELCPLNCCD